MSDRPGARHPHPRPSLRWPHHLALLLLVFPLALGTRFGFAAETGLGAEFHPLPDALEYAASARALSDGGRFYLQVGPEQVRPRYAPGWPLVLSLALRAGVPAPELWRISSVAGALFALALAELVAALTLWRFRGRPDRTLSAWPATLAGSFAGALWAIMPTAVDRGSMLMTDEPALLLQAAGFAALVLGLRAESRFPRTLLATAGFCIALLATLRLVGALLVAIPCCVVLGDFLARRGAADAVRASVALVAGGLPPVLATGAILVAAGFPLWPWDAYAYWDPQHYAELSSTFHLRHALEGSPDFTMVFGERRGHWQHATFLMLGLPGLANAHSAGLGWLAFAWGYGAWQLFTAKRHEVRVVGLALLALVGSNCLLFSLYFYPDTRFYFAPIAIAVALAGLLVGDCLCSQRRWATAVGAAFACAAASAVTFVLVSYWGEMWRLGGSPNAHTLTAAPAWLALDDTQRSVREMSFDTVRAQALGVLGYEEAARVGEWGRLAPTEHVRRLRRLHQLLPED